MARSSRNFSILSFFVLPTTIVGGGSRVVALQLSNKISSCFPNSPKWRAILWLIFIANRFLCLNTETARARKPRSFVARFATLLTPKRVRWVNLDSQGTNQRAFRNCTGIFGNSFVKAELTLKRIRKSSVPVRLLEPVPLQVLRPRDASTARRSDQYAQYGTVIVSNY